MKKTELLQLADQYAALEKRLQYQMQAACSQVCSACRQVCCRPDMCRESLESPFLVLVRERVKSKPTWSNERGWLGPKGCTLRVGRPPVCYEFLCQAITDSLSGKSSLKRLTQLSTLLTNAGRRAIGSDHLVEIMTMDRLVLVKPERLAGKFRQSEAELTALEPF